MREGFDYDLLRPKIFACGSALANVTFICHIVNMANVKKGQIVAPPEWWKHLRKAKRVFWKRERRAEMLFARSERAGG